MLPEFGATGSSKQIVVFDFPNSWRVIPRKYFVESVLPDFDSERESLKYGNTEDRILTASVNEHKYFDNNLDALRAAGWSDEETPKLRMPQKMLHGHGTKNANVEQDQEDRSVVDALSLGRLSLGKSGQAACRFSTVDMAMLACPCYSSISTRCGIA